MDDRSKMEGRGGEGVEACVVCTRTTLGLYISIKHGKQELVVRLFFLEAQTL